MGRAVGCVTLSILTGAGQTPLLAQQADDTPQPEAEKPVGAVLLKGQFLHASGNRQGDIDHQFVTPMGLFGASGYWGYTHIFTANGPEV